MGRLVPIAAVLCGLGWLMAAGGSAGGDAQFNSHSGNTNGWMQSSLGDWIGGPPAWTRLAFTSGSRNVPATRARPAPSPDSVVTFPDPNLEAAIREAIGKPTGDIYDSDLVGLTSFDAFSRGISDLTGLEYCINLQTLELNENPVADLGPLSGLTSLRTLRMGKNQIVDVGPLSGVTNLAILGLTDNQITDVSPLSGLNNLWRLGLAENQIADISPLSGLTTLLNLYLGHNQVADLSPLSGLTNLTRLGLIHNEIVDVSPLSGLTALQVLTLSHNDIADISPLSSLTGLELLSLQHDQISDISALVANSGLGAGDEIRLQENWLDLTPGSQASQDVQTLRDRGVTVYVDDQFAHSLHGLPAAGYYMVSLPLMPSAATPHDLFCDDLGDGNYYMWSWQAGGYQTLPTNWPGCQTVALSQNDGYWLLTGAATLDMGGTLPSGDQVIPLQAGWNMIGPLYEVTVDSLRVDNGGDVRSLADAQAAGWILATLYYSHEGSGSYNTVTIGQSPSHTLSLWYGYWVLGTIECSLVVPEPWGPLVATRAARSSPQDPAWAFDIQATSGTSTDSITIAAADEASDGFDGFGLDRPKPPAPPGEHRLRTVLKPNAVASSRLQKFAPQMSGWKARPTRRRAILGPRPYTRQLTQRSTGSRVAPGLGLAMETKGTAEDAAEWEFTVTGGVEGEPVTLSWLELSLLPKDRVAILKDHDTGKRTFMRTRAQYEFSAPGEGSSRSLAVTVKRAQQGAALISSFAVVPLRGAGGAEIAFSLSADASVNISVLNAAGRLVQRVRHGVAAEAGTHTVTWDGRSLSGTALPSGLYLCVLSAKAPDGQQARAVRPVRLAR